MQRSPIDHYEPAGKVYLLHTQKRYQICARNLFFYFCTTELKFAASHVTTL